MDKFKHYPEQEMGDGHERIFCKEDYATCKHCGRVFCKADEGFAVMGDNYYCMFNGCDEQVRHNG